MPCSKVTRPSIPKTFKNEFFFLKLIVWLIWYVLIVDVYHIKLERALLTFARKKAGDESCALIRQVLAETYLSLLGFVQRV